MAESDSDLVGGPVEGSPEFHIVGAGHVLEIRPAFQWRGAGEIEMISDTHERAGWPVGVQSSRSIRQQKTPHARAAHQTRDGPDVARRMAFIQMNAPRGGQQRYPVELVSQETPAVTGDRRGGQTRHASIRQFGGERLAIESSAKPGPEHDPDFRGEFFWKHGWHDGRAAGLWQAGRGRGLRLE